MFKFKGISSKDMQVVIEEEEHFIARASRRYETTEIEGRDGAIFEELGYSYVERPIYVQCLNIDKMDDILAWLDGEGEFEYKERKTTARFYVQQEPKREGYIRIIDTTFIRDPFWTKIDDKYIEVKGRKDNITERVSNLNVQDASGQNAKINVFGISKQETRSGKNKFDVTKLENVENIDSKTGSFAIKAYGTWIMAEENVSKLLKPNTQYKCIADVTLIESPQNASEGIATLLALNSSSAGSNAILSCSSLTEKNTWQLNETKRLESSFTTASDLSIFNMIHYGYHTSNWQATGKFKFENIMILESTEEDETFEEYGESPSPKYHSEIENTTGNIKITSCNKNLFNKNTVTEGKNIGNNGEFVINNNYFISDYILINKNVSLTLSGIEWGRIAFYDKDKNFIKYSANAESNDLIATSTEDTKYAVISSIIATIDNVQLEVSNTATDFEAHEEEVKTFPLSQNQKMFEGDYLADDGIHHKRKQIAFDGTENWEIYIWQTAPHTQTTIFSLTNILPQKNDAVRYCNYFNVVANTVTNLNKDEEYCLNSSAGTIYFSISNEIATTIEGFKNWLSQQKTAGTPVKLEYELETEEIEAYTEEQQAAYDQLQNAKTYKTVTNVFTDNAEVEMNYIADTTEKIVNGGNIYSRPILRLEKTISNKVDITIKDIRFQYDFKDEEYVEIDCEEKEGKYEGLNRNRQLKIGYEFPKLKIGDNNIIMHEGDCIIKAKRKDRWL